MVIRKRGKRTKTTREQALDLEGATSAKGHSTSLLGTRIRKRAKNAEAHSTIHPASQVRERATFAQSHPIDAHSTRLPGTCGTHVKDRATGARAHSTVRKRPAPQTSRPSSAQNNQSSISSPIRGSTEFRPPKAVKGNIHVQSTPKMNVHMDTHHTPGREAHSDPPEQGNQHVRKLKASRSRSVKSKKVFPNWPDKLDYDENFEVLTIDAEGNHHLKSGPIQPRDIDNLEAGVRCVVHFNEFNQPVRKGGFILVKYLGSLAKNKTFCPIRERTWLCIHDQYKADIIQLVRSRFIIPESETFNTVILTRVAKHWRQYKNSLKRTKFHPKIKTKEQIYNDIPPRQDRNSWIHLVDYWYSEESQELSNRGKEARASHSHVHTTGSTSYANKRADFVETKGRQPSHLEFFKLTHTKVDGNFVDDTISSQFLVEANAKVQELSNASSSKSEIEIENDVFDNLVYEEGKPKRPIGFGPGVKESDIFGVNRFLRKSGSGSTNSSVEIENLKATIASMKEENQELKARASKTNQILIQTLNAIRNGTVSSDFLEAAAHFALCGSDSQVASTSGDLEDFHATNPPK